MSLRKFVIVVTGLAFVLGASLPVAQASWGASEVTQDSGCAATKAGDTGSLARADQAPCECATINCAGETGCVFSPGLVVPSVTLASPFANFLFAGWPRLAALPGLSIKPALFPPIAS
ncbi:MAG: hypothetical protein L0Y57_00080 [Beijerinckiaceae bacterium]|nr:hypothetical protein [Beijerinckiaceae bacterium]